MLILAALGCNGDDGTDFRGDDDDVVVETAADTAATAISTPNGLSGRLVEGQESVIRVSWTQEVDATTFVEFEFEGETRQSPPRALAPGPHEELLLGIPYGADVTFRLFTGDTVSEDATLRTGALPLQIPFGALERSGDYDPAVPYLLLSIDEAGGYFLSARWWTLLVDRQGRVVWAHRSPDQRSSIHPRISVDGSSFLVDHNSFWGAFDGGEGSEVVSLRIDGSEAERWDTPGLHHPFTQLPDGTLVYGRYLDGHGGYNEDIVALPPDGGVEVLMVCLDWLASIGEYDEVCGSNTLSYDAGRDKLMISWFTFDAMTELDLQTLEVERWFGQVAGSYAFLPSEATFWYQHGGHFTDAGTLLLSTHRTEEDVELVAREYVIDDTSRALRQIWSAGEDEGESGQQMGEAHRLPSGNTLHNFGTNAHLREYTTGGEVVWEMDWADEHTIGRSAPVTQSLWDFAPPRP